MTPKERVMKALKLQEGLPDRIPIQFDLCRSLLEHFSNELAIPLSITDNVYEDVTWRISANEIRLALGSDAVITGISTAKDFKPEMFEDGKTDDGYGSGSRISFSSNRSLYRFSY